MIYTTNKSKMGFIHPSLIHSFLNNHDRFSIINCLSFFTKAAIAKRNLKAFYEKMGQLGVPVTNEMIGVIEWPYIHNKWDIEKRLNIITAHYELLHDRALNLMKVHQGEEIKIMQFDEAYEDVSVVLDRPNWFIREGETVINIVHNDLRVASIAFTLSYVAGRATAYIGAIQGIHSGIPSEQSLAIYKRLTKLFHGLRPRTLLLEALKVHLKALGITQLYGVADQNRHHRHRYFGFDQKTPFKNDYNAFWEEHGGHLNKRKGFYAISLNASIREIEAIPSKKRSQYRKRNAMIESLETCLSFNE